MEKTSGQYGMINLNQTQDKQDQVRSYIGQAKEFDNFKVGRN
jgi:hypothetical protein